MKSRKSSVDPAQLKRRLLTGILILSGITMAALISLVLPDFDPGTVDISQKFLPPSFSHPFGTDQFGRDLMALVMRGGLSSLLVALSAVVIGAACGIPLGLMAAFNRRIADPVIMRMSDFLFAFPALLVAVLLRETVGPGLLNAIIAIGIFNIPVFVRITYSAALNVLAKDFIVAARLSGRSAFNLAIDHVLPFLFPVLIVQITIQMALGLLAEASLSYVGLGVVPPMPSWGRMLNEAQTLLAISPQFAIIPGLAIVLTVYAFSLIGDSLRDLWDVRHKRGGGVDYA